MKDSSLEYGNIFVVAFKVSDIWEDQKSYVKGFMDFSKAFD